MRAMFSMCLLSISLVGLCQPALTPERIDSLKTAIEAEAQQLGREMEAQDDYLTEGDRGLEIEFAMDTFRIKRFMSQQVEFNWSTQGMAMALYEAEAAYDGLLNKYYRRIMGKISPEDQATLRTAQRSWIQFRDSERELIGALAQSRNSGGGSLQRLIVASRILDLTEARVITLVNYLSRIYRE